jgi:hypothetical protein
MHGEPIEIRFKEMSFYFYFYVECLLKKKKFGFKQICFTHLNIRKHDEGSKESFAYEVCCYVVGPLTKKKKKKRHKCQGGPNPGIVHLLSVQS